MEKQGYKQPFVKYNTGSSTVDVTDSKGKTKKINAKHLRESCKCALCVDEFSGKKIMNKEKIPDSVFPAKIEKKGNYAVAIIWSDGHNSSIYPFET